MAAGIGRQALRNIEFHEKCYPGLRSFCASASLFFYGITLLSFFLGNDTRLIVFENLLLALTFYGAVMYFEDQPVDSHFPLPAEGCETPMAVASLLISLYFRVITIVAQQVVPQAELFILQNNLLFVLFGGISTIYWMSR